MKRRLVTGPRAVSEALSARGAEVQVLYVAPGARGEVARAAARARELGLRVETREETELDNLGGGLRHQGIIAIVGPYPYLSMADLLTDLPASPILVALDQVTDPHNLGAIVRTAVALGVHGLITLKNRAAPVTAAAVRASAGATEHAKIARVPNLAHALTTLRNEGMQIFGLDAEGSRDLEQLHTPPEGAVLVVGAEGHGLRRLTRKNCTELVRIPLRGPVASLNVSVAAAIAIYALSCTKPL